nr:ATP synthase F0 subunit 8 [Tripetaloceroides tonkinensis]
MPQMSNLWWTPLLFFFPMNIAIMIAMLNLVGNTIIPNIRTPLCIHLKPWKW